MDATIVFADITTPLAGMGVEFEIVPDVGPVIDRPIRSLADVESGTRMVAEGVRTVREALALGAEHEVRMPICEAVAAVLFAGTPPADALTALLSRELRDEEDGGPHPYA